MEDPEEKEVLWTRQEIFEALGATCPNDERTAISSISIDSRSVKKNALFFAIRGHHYDGHDFVKQALAAGAAFAVVSRERAQGLDAHRQRLLVVDDVLSALQHLAKAARQRFKGTCIAITGSVGKTGTKEMLRRAFQENGNTHASIASFNNHWGVPLSVARTPRDCDFSVFEVGMNHAGEIASLVGLIAPHLAIITNVEPVHLEFFETEQEIARAKTEIFSGIIPGGKAIVNRDNRHFHFIRGRADEAGIKFVSFGKNTEADIRLIGVQSNEQGSMVTVALDSDVITYKIGQPGRHIVMNSLAVVAALFLAGADVRRGLSSLSCMKAEQGRGARFSLCSASGQFTLLDESYNANPASMRAAIMMLGEMSLLGHGRRIAVLGDMLELGDEGPKLHKSLASSLRRANIDQVYACGPLMRELYETLPAEMQGEYAPISTVLQNSLSETVAKDDIVMVKGSLGSQMGLIVDAFRKRFRESSSAALKS